MTIPALAERFEVSKRTINRDIEDICRAGIPLVTVQGVYGGISILSSYKLDKTLFTDADLRAIFAGLSSLDSIAQNKKYQAVLDKFPAHNNTEASKTHLLIDLSSHRKDTLAPKIELLQQSIEHCSCVSFAYHNQKGERTVNLDPYLVVYRWAGWYVLGFDCGVQQFKLYKLNRICYLRQTGQHFALQDIPKEKLELEGYFTDQIQAVILFDKSEKYRLVEEYGVDSFEETRSGRLRFSFPFTNQDYLLTWILSFGEKAELIQPDGLRGLLRARLENARAQYQE